MKRPTAAALLLAAYVLLLLDMTLLWFPQDHPRPNLTPFKSISRDRHLVSDTFLVNFVGNLVAFAPFGILPPLIWPRRASAWRVAAGAAALSGSIEVAQFLSGRRIADVDDVILNTTGALLGYAAFAVTRRRGRPTEE